MTLAIENGEYKVLIRSDLMNVFYVVMKIVPIVTNFKRLIYQTFNETNLI